MSFCSSFSVLEFGGRERIGEKTGNWNEGVLIYLGEARETLKDAMDSKGSFSTEGGQQASEKGRI